MTTEEFDFVELNQSEVSDEVINEFDCGNRSMTEYLHQYAKDDTIKGKGVTYVLVTADRKRIYAYATIATYSLYYYEDAEKFHTKEMNEFGKVLLAVPSIEIKMFAISKKLKGQIAYLLDPKNQQHYSSIFFKLFLEKLYYMSMSSVGFQMVFLRANDEGERLYRNNKFVECDKYLSTYDAMAEGCTSLAITLTEIEYVLFPV